MAKLTLLIPPTLEELLEDEVYGAYASKKPRLPDNCAHGCPWQTIARRHPEYEGARWSIRKFESYRDARRYALDTILPDQQWDDVSIVSRRVLFRPPLDFTWNQSKFAWCGRCRRPTLFRNTTTHPALKHAPVITTDSPVRCYYCGIRQVSMPTYRPRRRTGHGS